MPEPEDEKQEQAPEESTEQEQGKPIKKDDPTPKGPPGGPH